MGSTSERTDWLAWHAGYERDVRRAARLSAVRLHVRACLDAMPPGPISVLSLCAGDGRDLRGALIGHPRTADVRAHLVEIDARLVDQGREAARVAGLASQMHFVCDDAARASLYSSLVPADLVLLCGVVRHVRRRETPRLVAAMAAMCAEGGYLVWTRRVTNFGKMFRLSEVLQSSRRFLAQRSAASADEVRELLCERSFTEVRVDGRWDLVVTSRHVAPIEPLARDGALFRFSTT